MKKKILALALVVVLAVTAVTGATLAYFTDTDDNANVFTMGNIDITLDEAAVERKEDKWVADEDKRVQENTYADVYPGAVLPKDPTVHNVGSYGAFVRVKVTVVNGMTMLPMYVEDDTVTDNLYDDCFMAMVGKLGEGWTITDVMAGNTDATFVITYGEEVAPNKDTTPVFETITIPADWTQDDPRLTSIQKTGFEINVVAEAIQADNFANVTAAFAAYDAE